MRGDGKGKFFRQCNLDKVTWETIKVYKKIKKKMLESLAKRNK